MTASDKVKEILNGMEDTPEVIEEGKPLTGLENIQPARRPKVIEIAALKLMRKTNREVADELGMHVSTISKIIAGDAYQLIVEQVREKMIESRGDITKRLEREQDRNLEILLNMRDNDALQANERRLIIKDLNEWLRDPPTGRDRIKETVTLKVSGTPEPDEVLDEHEDTAPSALIPLILDEDDRVDLSGT